MSARNVGSNLALTVCIILGVATLGLCSVISLENSADDVVVLPLSIQGASSTTLDDPVVSNGDSSASVALKVLAAAASWTNTSTRSFEECGVANSNSLLSAASDDGGSSRIAGGDLASPNEFPWQAFLNVEMTSGAIYYCGGTLIADRWILTSANCLVVSGQTLKSVNVYLGAHDITATSEVNRRVYSGSQVFLHPDYNANNQGDIAMIQLTTSVTYTQYIRPVCLATSTEPNYVNSPVTVTGWGTTSDGAPSLNSLLRKVSVPVITNAECSSTYGGNVVTDKIMCTSGANSRGICTGDGGGPMNVKQTDGTWKQIGIASFYSSTGCASGGPSAYTRLSSYSTWVQNTVSSNTPTTTTTSTTTTTPTTTTPTTTTTNTKPTTTPTPKTTTSTTPTSTTKPTTTATTTSITATTSTTPKPSSANQSFAFLSSALISFSLIINLKISSLQ